VCRNNGLINILGHCRAYDVPHQGRGRINGRERPVVRNRRIAMQQQLYVSYDTNLLIVAVPQFTRGRDQRRTARCATLPSDGQGHGRPHFHRAWSNLIEQLVVPKSNPMSMYVGSDPMSEAAPRVVEATPHIGSRQLARFVDRAGRTKLPDGARRIPGRPLSVAEQYVRGHLQLARVVERGPAW